MSRKTRLLLCFAIICSTLVGATIFAPPIAPAHAAATDLSVALSVGSLAVGQTGTYTATVTNNGPGATAVAIGLTDTLPGGLTFASNGGSGWDCTGSSGQNVTCQFTPVLNPSAITTLTLNVNVGVTAFPQVSNTVTIASSEDTNPANNSASQNNTPVAGAPDMGINMSNSGILVVGQNVTFTITATNFGQIAPASIQVTDTLPSTLTFQSATGTNWGCSVLSGTVTCNWTGGAVGPGTSTTAISLVVTPNTAGSIVNSAAVAAPSDYNSGNNTTSNTINVANAPDVAIISVTHSSAFVVGINNSWTIQAQNVGLGATTSNTTITITFTGGVTGIPASSGGSQFTCTGTGPMTCTRTTAMAASEVANLTINVTPTAGGAASASATIATTNDLNAGNDTKADNLTIGAVDIAVTKTNPAFLRIGIPATYTVVLNNPAAANAVANITTVTLTETISTGMTYNSGTSSDAAWSCPAGPTAGPATVTCTYAGGINPGASSGTLNLSLTPTTTGNKTNQVDISTPGDTTAGGNNQSITGALAVDAPDLAINFTKPAGPYLVGTNFDYTVTVANIGTAPTASVTTVTYTVPAKLAIVSFNVGATGWACAPAVPPAIGAGGTLTCNFGGVIANGGAAPNFTITVQPTATGTTASTMSVSVALGDPPGNNTFTEPTFTINAPPTPVLGLTLTHTGTSGNNFQVSTNTGTVVGVLSNTGTTATTGTITVTFNLAGGLTMNAAASSNTTLFPNANCVGTTTVTCTSAAGQNLAAAGSVTLTLTVTAPATPAAGPFTNTASATNASATPTTTNATDAVSFAIVAAPSADLDVITAPDGLTHAGNFVSGTPGTYNLTIKNVGAADAAIGWKFTMTSPMPANLTFTGAAGGFAAFTCTGTGTAVMVCTSPAALVAGNSITGQITAAPVAATTVTVGTTVQVSATGDTVTGNDFATDPTLITAAAAPDLTITKTAPASFTVNQNGTYTFTVNNIGSGTANLPITVTDTLNAAFTFVSGSGASCSATGTPQVVTCNLSAPIAALGNASFTIVVTPTNTNGGIPVTNSASVATTGDANPGNNTSNTTSTTINGVPNLTVSKSHAGNFVVTSGSGTYTIVVRNIGNGPTSGTITVVDTLPSMLSFGPPNGAATGGWACSGTPVVTCTNTTVIGAGGSASFNLTVNVNTVGSSANGIAVSGGGMVGTFTGTPDPTTVDAAPLPAFTLTKTGPAAFTVGQNGNYTISVRNSGSGPTDGTTITVSDSLPGGQSLVSGSGTGWTCTGTTAVSCTTSAGVVIAAGATSTITLTVTNPSVNPGVVNTATVSGGGVATSATGSTPSIPINGVPDVTITKAAIGTFIINQQGTYSVTVTNNGSAATTGTLTVTDTLPAGMTFASGSGSGWSCSGVGQIVNCTNPASLPAGGGSTTFNITANVTGSGTLVNNVSVGAVPGETNTGNNSATATVTVAPPNPDSISPTLSTATANPTSTVINTGSSTITVSIRTFAGAIPPANTVTVALSGNPNSGVTVSPSTTMLADASGNAVFTVRSSVAQTTTFTITASNGFGTVTLTSQPSVQFTATGTATPGVVVAANSSIISDCLSIPGDNLTAANITVTLHDGNNSPVASKGVTLVGSPANASVLIQPTSTTTDASGVAKFTLRTSLTSGSTTLTANTSDVPPVIISGATVNFTAVGTKCVPNTAATAAATAATVGGVPLLTVPSSGPLTGIVIASRLNVRVGPGITFDRIGQLLNRTTVVLLCKNPRGSWYQIQLFNGTAWVSAIWIRVTRVVFRLVPICGQNSPGTAILQPGQLGEATGIVNTYLLRVRTGPGSDFPQIGLVQLGQEITILGKNEEGTWFKVRLDDGSTGWVSAFFIKIKRIPNKVLPIVS